MKVEMGTSMICIQLERNETIGYSIQVIQLNSFQLNLLHVYYHFCESTTSMFIFHSSLLLILCYYCNMVIISFVFFKCLNIVDYINFF